MSESVIPKVLVLGPITPATESVRADQLAYENLKPAVTKHLPYEADRQQVFWDSAPGSLDERAAAEQLAAQYMLAGALKLNQEATTPESTQLWSERYTKATSELYGAPDPEIAQSLLSAQAGELIRKSARTTVNRQVATKFTKLCEQFGVEASSGPGETVFAETAQQIGDFLDARFLPVFEALELENQPAKIEPEGIASAFEHALTALTQVYDSSWADWTVERREDKDQLSIVAGDKQILVGMKRAAVTPLELKGLVGHELLLHGQRGVNGSKKSKQLGAGIPGYLDAEEGIGVFFEYAITGVVPDKNVDRYVDIALALGQIDGVSHTRKELLEFAMTRELIRNQAKPFAEQKSAEDIEKAVYAHVNRIYRGSLGNQYVGVFTKDSAYHRGFVEAGNYISDQLNSGKTPMQIVDFLLQGKFDPANSDHLALLETST